MTTRVLTTTLPLPSAGCHNNEARFMRPLSSADLETHWQHGHMQEPDHGCQGFVLTVASSFVSIPGDVISVNSVSCVISIRPRLLKQMSPSQGSISFSHLIIRIESGSISRSQSDRDAPNPWIGTTIPQSILTLHKMGKVVKESWIFCGNQGFVGFPNFHGLERC